MNEHFRMYRTNTKRRINYKPLGERKKLSVTLGSASTDYPIGSQRTFQSCDCRAFECFPSNRSIVAGTFFSTPLIRTGERCSSPWTFSKDSSKESYCHCKRHSTYNASQCNPLERPQYGQSTGSQQEQYLANLETTQSKTSSGQNFQTQPRQTVSRETLRYCRSLSKSTRQSDCLLCRREKPDSSTRTYTTITSLTTRNSSQTNARLHASWHNDVICSIEHTRWYCYWRLYATTQTSGIYQVPATHQHKNPIRFGSSSDCGQLRDTQTPPCSEVAKTSPQVLPAFYSYIQFLAKSGRTMVFRNNIEKNSSRLIQKFKRANHGY